MKKIISIDGVEIIQKNFQQVLIRGDGKEKFNQIINKEISILPPSKNLEVVKNNSYLFAKKIPLITLMEFNIFRRGGLQQYT